MRPTIEQFVAPALATVYALRGSTALSWWPLDRTGSRARRLG
jgi:hypothetical protein